MAIMRTEYVSASELKTDLEKMTVLLVPVLEAISEDVLAELENLSECVNLAVESGLDKDKETLSDLEEYTIKVLTAIRKDVKRAGRMAEIKGLAIRSLFMLAAIAVIVAISRTFI